MTGKLIKTVSMLEDSQSPVTDSIAHGIDFDVRLIRLFCRHPLASSNFTKSVRTTQWGFFSIRRSEDVTSVPRLLPRSK